MTGEVLASTTVRNRRRLLPFLLLMYIVAFLDRANIGFAKMALQKAEGITALQYAWGAGLFFLPYALCEVPSNLLLKKVGARVWMARIMVSWGIISAAMIFVRGAQSFYLLRILLGAAEAGFFPGVIFYLTYWFPNRERGKILGLFYLGAPLALIIGAPVSGLLLRLHGALGLESWQWLFLTEGLAAVAVGLCSLVFLPDGPEKAGWLSATERSQLVLELAAEEQARREHGPSKLWTALKDPKLLHFAIVYLLIQMAVYAVVFYLPADLSVLMKHAGPVRIGFLGAIPWTCALIATAAIPGMAARRGQNKSFAVAAIVLSGIAGLFYLTPHPAAAIVALSVGAAGLIAVQPIFWTFPTGYLSDRAAAGGIAAINAIGAIGGFMAPNVKAYADRFFGSPRAGLYVLSGFALLTAVLIALLPRESEEKPIFQQRSAADRVTSAADIESL